LRKQGAAKRQRKKGEKEEVVKEGDVGQDRSRM